MGAFDGRQVPLFLLDYGLFRDRFKGMNQSEIMSSVDDGSPRFTLPHVVYTADTAAFYPRLDEICDKERSAIALAYTDPSKKEEVVWISAEIDSKLEATAEATEFWCDRLEMAALNCNFSRIKLWLVAPEGFDGPALKILADRNAVGSSRSQAELLMKYLGAVPAVAETNSHEYEFVVPMGPDTEMISAHAVEEIAKRANFPAKAVNQIKTALVEACINAAEHSLSPDRRIYQRFRVDDQKLTVSVSNRGVRIADKSPQMASGGRRGWGMKLIEGLMDDVRIDHTDDGTRITMVKYLPTPKK